VKKFGTAPNKILLKAHFFWDINLKFETQLVQIFGFGFFALLGAKAHQVLKIYILYKI